MSKLDDFIAKSEHFQGEVIARLDNMERQRIEDRDTRDKRCDNHGNRIDRVENGQRKVAVASASAGALFGVLAAWWQGRH